MSALARPLRYNFESEVGTVRVEFGAEGRGSIFGLGLEAIRMRKVLTVLLFLSCFVAELSGEPARYDGYKLLRVQARHRRDLDAIKSIYDSADDRLDFWREPRSVDEAVDIMVGPEHEEFIRLLLKNGGGLVAQNIIDDIQAAIDEQKEARAEEEHFFGRYHDLSKINEWMFTLANEFPDIAAVKQVATSYEGRPMHLIKLSGKQAADTVKPAIVIMAGIHAREWLSPATIMFIANELVSNYSKDTELQGLVDGLDWYIIPVTNVDGYIYTWETQRLWRKTRSEYDSNQCVGVDPNRNFGFHWGGEGVSFRSCDDTYAGPFAFSEQEVEELTKYLTRLNEEQPILAFMDFHAYSQLWMTPYGYDDVKPENYLDQFHLASKAAEALMAVNGTRYNVGSIAEVIYKASGNSVDWAHGELGIPFAYAVELPDRGRYGFLMPPSYIIPTGLETLEAMKVVGHGVIEHGMRMAAEKEKRPPQG